MLRNSKSVPIFEHTVLTIQPGSVWASSTLRTQRAGFPVTSCLGSCVAYVPQLDGHTGLHPDPSDEALSGNTCANETGVRGHMWQLNRNQMFTSFNFHSLETRESPVASGCHGGQGRAVSWERLRSAALNCKLVWAGRSAGMGQRCVCREGQALILPAGSAQGSGSPFPSPKENLSF